MTYEEKAIQAAEELKAFDPKAMAEQAMYYRVPREELRNWMRTKKDEWPGCFYNHVCEGLGPSMIDASLD